MNHAVEKLEGISFLVRVHDEEATLEQSITSLFGLLISYEIILLLNMCTDASAVIATRLAAIAPQQNIRIFEYNHWLSRPGYETLATDFDSVHSFPAFLNWGLQWTRYKWVAKWDADFIMTPTLRDALNAEGQAGRWALGHQILQLGARSEDGTIEYGDYFSSCFDYYRKDLFWETPVFRFDPQKHVRLRWTDPHIEHASSVNRLKAYWSRPGWYAMEPDVGTHEAVLVRARLLELERHFGMMPMGMGRAGTTDDAVEIGRRIRAAV